MSVLTFSNFQAAHPNKDGTKTVPAKVQGSDGNSYAMSKDALPVIQANLGVPLDVDTSSKPNGQYINYTVLAVRPVAKPAAPVPPTAPVSAPIPTPPVQERVAVTSPPSSWHPAPDRERLIVRQSSLRAAVDLTGDAVVGFNDVLKLADIFVDWVFQVGVYASSDTATPTSPAQSALNEVRQKSADLRSAYLPNQLVCPNCGRSEYIKEGSQGFFCKRTEGALGCGYPPRGERLDALITYAEWQQRAPGVPWK